jgi:antirestriction protein ArdC
MTTAEMRLESLTRAQNGSALTNYPAIFAGFLEKGIAEADILPRLNVLTFNAWKAMGRHVRKGEHGVKVLTWIPVQRTAKDGTVESGKRPRTATVFHVSQTEEE